MLRLVFTANDFASTQFLAQPAPALEMKFAARALRQGISTSPKTPATQAKSTGGATASTPSPEAHTTPTRAPCCCARTATSPGPPTRRGQIKQLGNRCALHSSRGSERHPTTAEPGELIPRNMGWMRSPMCRMVWRGRQIPTKESSGDRLQVSNFVRTFNLAGTRALPALRLWALPSAARLRRVDGGTAGGSPRQPRSRAALLTPAVRHDQVRRSQFSYRYSPCGAIGRESVVVERFCEWRPR